MPQVVLEFEGIRGAEREREGASSKARASLPYAYPITAETSQRDDKCSFY